MPYKEKDSILNGWQRTVGYCRAYNEGASHFSKLRKIGGNRDL